MNLLSLMRLLRFSIFTLVIVGLSITHAADNPSPTEQPLTTNEVQERAVPPNIEGAIMQGNQLKAAPGYVLEKGANNQLTVRRKAGGTSTINAHCGCSGSAGSCVIGFNMAGDVAVCSKYAEQPCNNRCEWSVVESKVSPPRGR